MSARLIEKDLIANERFFPRLIAQLVRGGVRYFCIAPGSRNTPLTVAIARHEEATTFVHFDERALAFHALGYAKATGSPVAVVVTSGTAVGNLLPAVMEATLSHTPLLLLTGDRPPESRDTGVNQTCDQVKIFHNFIRWQVDLPCPTDALPPSFIDSTVTTALLHMQHPPPGPVHINCMVREPFFTAPLREKPEVHHHPLPHLVRSSGVPVLPEAMIEEIASLLASYEKGIIITGVPHAPTDTEALTVLSRTLQWPVFPDILSPCRIEGASHPEGCVVPYYELLIEAFPEEDSFPEAILQLGDRFVSKGLFLWLRKAAPSLYVLSAPHAERIDPLHIVTHRLISDPDPFIRKLIPRLRHFPPPPSDWYELWRYRTERADKALPAFFAEQKNLTESVCFRTLLHMSARPVLFIGNSIPIREADRFFAPATCHPLRKFPVLFANRGVSGIDGNIATIAGIAVALKQPVVALIGDLTLLHDMTSLAQIKELESPVTLIVFNNEGGGIFSFLPISSCASIHRPFFQAPHGIDIEKVATLFAWEYEKMSTLSSLSSRLDALPSRPTLLEVDTEAEETKRVHDGAVSALR
ncbi:MAG: 2-succinyl-5-enolpyruvyl-6-hydroxy-3-cyclohexene-1-carboxylic-acid synthase [Simkaniaceae bacterium]|nr:2-succinyl-5-enolpyruvyl-6-hydroxy-3-cyclohexene-1-carboxylic-acid synthase [Simkaniaceae bacterium]